MSLTFREADRIFREYGLVPTLRSDGKRIEYGFDNKRSHTGKRNVATEIYSMVNGGVRGYISVAYLEEFKFAKDAPIGYPFIKTAMEHIKINDMSELELRSYLDRITAFYK